MKREIVEHVAICDSCKRIKVEHQRLAGLLQLLQIPQWKWDEIGMDFIVGLPSTRAGYDSTWVVVDRLTKSAHFIPVKTSYNRAIHVLDRLSAWCAKEDSVKLRNAVHFTFLAVVA
jgi:hypothetical protein